jgi:hypothetical protein
MTEDFLEYPKLMERAMRGVVQEALTLTAAHGLPGLHHFYVTFATRAPGVDIPDSLIARYPDEMTIVLEHQFWDLSVEDEAFSVTLSFNDQPERLRIPFDAITSFVDPSVKFGLQFQVEAAAPAESTEAPETAPEDTPDDAAPTGDETVIALDSFRKK